MLNYMIIFKECFRTAQLIRFKVYSFVTPFSNTEVPGWIITLAYQVGMRLKRVVSLELFGDS